MGRKRAPAILLLLLSAVGGPAASAQEKPPRPLDAVLQDLGSKFGKTKEQAARELAAMGPEAVKAVPDLLKTLADPFEPARVWAAVALARIDPKEKAGVPVLLKALGTKREGLPLAAAGALGAYDPSTPGVVDALLGVLGDPSLSESAVRGIAGMGEKTLPFLLKALEPADPPSTAEILRVVRALGNAGIPVALAVLDHPRLEIRRSMAQWLAKDTQGESPPEIHFLLADLGDPAAAADKVKAAEEGALARGASFVPGLAGLLGTSPHPSVHLRVTRILGLLGPAAREALPALRAEGAEIGAGLRESALLAMASIDPKAPTAPSREWGFSGAPLFALRPHAGAPAKARADAPGSDEPLRLGLEWLARHQSPDGLWECAGFVKRCSKPCGGAGLAQFDAGVTALALLAFLGAGETPASPRYGPTVRKGIEALIALQDNEGCIGGLPDSGGWVLNHAVACLALSESCAATGGLVLERRAQNAVNFALYCENPYLGWGYGKRPQTNDTASTTWMLLALRVAKEAGLDVDPATFDGGKAWLDKVTEPEYGRSGYEKRNDGPPRYKGWTDYRKFPSEWFEGLTAMAILSRIVAGADREDEFVKKGLSLVLRPVPEGDPSLLARDYHCMHFTALATFLGGSNEWYSTWNSLRRTLEGDQNTDRGDPRCGSWDPVDPWSHGGGRVYSTAINLLTLETPYRYAKLRPLFTIFSAARPR